MATLNKIREKQGLLVGIIGFALVLFILSIAFDNNMNIFRACSRIDTEFEAGGVEVNKEKVDEIVQRYTENADKSRYNSDQIRQMAIMQLAQQAMINKQCEKLGIVPAPTLLGQMMEYDQQFVYQLAMIMANANPPVQIVSLQQAKALLDNPKGQDAEAIAKMKAAWAAHEQEITDQYNLFVFNNLVSGLFTASNVDAKSVYTNKNTYSSVTYVSAPIAQDTLKASEADKKAVYEDLKWQFYVPTYRASLQGNNQNTIFYEEPVRVVDVAAVFVQPSAEDKAKTYSDFAQFIAAISQEGDLIAAPQGTTTQPVAGFAPALKANTQLQQMLGVDAEALGQILAGDTIYVRPSSAADMQHVAMAISSVEERVDSVQATFRVALGAAPADSVEELQYWILPGTANAELANGLAQQYMTLVPALQTENPAPEAIQGYQSTLDKVNDLALSATVNAPVQYVDSVNNIYVTMTVDKRNPKTPYVSGTVYTAQAVPSSQTLFDLRQRLLNISTNASAAALLDSVNVHNITYRDMPSAPLQMVGASSPYISLGYMGPIENSRQAVKWAMDKKVGDISPIFENNDVIYVVAIREAIKDNFIPMNSPLIADFIEYRAKAQHNGAEAMKNYSGATLAELAKSMGQETITDNNFNLTGRTFLSSDPQLSGKVAGAAAGQLVGPMVVGNSVVAFNVVEHKQPTMPFVAANYTRDFVNTYSPANDLFLMLAGKGKVKNNGLEYVSSEEDLEYQRAMQSKMQQ